MENKKIGVISLGCDKNRVDTEKMLAILSERHVITPDIENAQIIIINTCAFLQSSRKEALEEVFSVARYKEQGSCEKIILTGCLPQRFVGDIFSELYEVDAFLGVSDYDEINSVIDKIYLGERVNAVGEPKGECGIKRIKTTNHYAYVKIADGCSNHCTYCLIPYIRGKYRSIPTEEIIREIKLLGNLPELILVAQDTTAYGKDLTPKTSLAQLVGKISQLKNVQTIRLLYCYFDNITEELIEEFATNQKLLKYIDIPLQHADDGVLKLMNRRGTGKEYLELIEKLKQRVPDIAIRSTFITGFPNESQQAFDNLVAFLQKAKLFNAGFFKFSKEEGTPAYKLAETVSPSQKTARLKKLYSVQKAVVKQNLKALVGKTISVLAEGFDENQFVYHGRAYFNAPDVDGKIYFFSDREIDYGNFYQIKITSVDGYDLYGERI